MLIVYRRIGPQAQISFRDVEVKCANADAASRRAATS